MAVPQVILDTNVLIAGLRSKRGSAFQILTLVGTGRFDIHLSVPLVLEYREVLLRELSNLYITADDVEAVLEFHCSVATHHRIFFLWRPFLSDPGDDMVLELAVKAGCDSVVTYNARDFGGIEKFGLRTISPSQFLQSLGVQP
ncbi:MAG: putative toxin-antitoxin system toxin component, PIN family [Thermosynechococcaceae cyanobacterium]